jgi:hypothetical protein
MVAPAPSDLRGWIASWHQTPIARVTVAGRTVLRVTDVEVSLGYDQQSAEAQVTAAAPTIPTWSPGDPVTVQVGFAGSGGALQPVFGGEVEDVDLRYFPHEVSFRAAGYLRRLQFRYGDELSWSNVEDGALWADLMRRSGVPRYQDAAGEGIVYGTRGPVLLRAGETPRDLVDALDQSSPTGMRTYEVAGTVYRSPVLGVPAGRVGASYAQGGPWAAPSEATLHLVEVERTDTVADLANRVRVGGLPEADGTEVFADRRADSPYVPVDADGLMRDIQFDFSSDLLETREQCDALAQRYLIERNKRTDRLRLRAPLNPLLAPGRTLGLTSEKLGLFGERPYWIEHVRHSVGADGAFTEVDLVGGAGETGYLIGLDPVAAFTATGTREAFLVGGVTTGVVTVHFDGSPSYDPDGQIVSWEWSTSTGKSGSGTYWSTDFTDAEWTAGVEVTLTVTDDDDDPTGPHTGSVTQSANAEITRLLIRTVYVAASGAAEATPDGGETWNTWTPPAGLVTATPQIAALDHSYFGLSTGELWRTADALTTAPELVHTFPAGVSCVWVNEANAARVWVGCEDGTVWKTAEAGLGATAGWVQRTDFAGRVAWLVESYATDDEVRACVGDAVFVTFDGFATYGRQTTLAGGEAKSIALSFFGNYAAGAAAAPVVAEGSSAAVPFPGASPPPADVRITAFADRDGLMALDELGRAFVKAAGATGFAAVAGTGVGACGGVVRDGEQASVFYAASAGGLVKTFDAGGSWRALRAYGGATAGLQVGYGAAPMTPAPRIVRVIRGTDGSVGSSHAWTEIAGNGTIVACTLWNPAVAGGNDPPPAGWQTPAFDDAVPWTGFGGLAHPWLGPEYAVVGGNHMMVWRCWSAWNDDAGPTGTRDREQTLFRHAFTLPPGPYRRAWLDSWNLVERATDAFDLVWRDAVEVYVNGHALGPARSRLWIDPAWLVDDGTTDNVIAVRGASHRSDVAGRRCGWKLTASTDPDGVQLATAPDGALVWTAGDDGTVLNAAAAPPDWGAAARPEEANGPVGSAKMTPGETPAWVGGGSYTTTDPGSGFADLLGIGMIPAANPSPGALAGHFYWHRFVCRLPADLTVARARLTVLWPAHLDGPGGETGALVEQEHLQLALNGVPLAGGVDAWWPDIEAGPPARTAFARRFDPLDPALLRPGQLNVLAALLHKVDDPAAAGQGNLAFYLEMR